MFSSYIGFGSSALAEVQAILKACQLCVSDCCPSDIRIIIESDSMATVAWVNGNSGVGNVSLMDYILDIKEIVAKCKPRLSVTHVSRTTNVVADFLAKQREKGTEETAVVAPLPASSHLSATSLPLLFVFTASRRRRTSDSEEKESWDMSTPEKMEAAGKKKEDGNALFKAGKYARAAKRYEKYIEYDSSFGEEEKKQAKALKVLELESRNVKALYRRAQAYIQLADLDLAEFDIKKALEIDPDNRKQWLRRQNQNP
ncbi:hypothetical protein EZV62_012331 [Acer yangbiense]|uniref:RNase H type-1 domain-containing protein n=1 Tax=Acer yangbiense TaxID=1000413 RepID=A0A5C7HW03_9ROSI|nr:hypothetical protein EZV62_012331 [Acer yangbiense]